MCYIAARDQTASLARSDLGDLSPPERCFAFGTGRRDFLCLRIRRLSRALARPSSLACLSTANTLVLLLSRASGPLTWVVANVAARYDAVSQPGKLRFFVAWAWRRLIAATLVGLALAGGCLSR